jgi:hypothetical protein
LVEGDQSTREYLIKYKNHSHRVSGFLDAMAGRHVAVWFRSHDNFAA